MTTIPSPTSGTPRPAAVADGLPSIPIVVDPLGTLAVGILPMVAGVGAALLSGFLLRRSDLAHAVRFNEG